MAVVTDKQFFILGGLAVAAAVWAWYKADAVSDAAGEWVASVKDTAAELGEKVNPASPNNVIYTGVNALGQAATGDESYTLGGSIYDMVDSVRGWWGDSDADRQAAAYAEGQARLQAQQQQADPNAYETNAAGFGTPGIVAEPDYNPWWLS